MRFWLTFVEPFFGLPPRQYDAPQSDNNTRAADDDKDSDSENSEAPRHKTGACFLCLTLVKLLVMHA